MASSAARCILLLKPEKEIVFVLCFCIGFYIDDHCIVGFRPYAIVNFCGWNGCTTKSIWVSLTTDAPILLINVIIYFNLLIYLTFAYQFNQKWVWMWMRQTLLEQIHYFYNKFYYFLCYCSTVWFSITIL